MLCGYEITTLERIASRDLPDDPGAAWWAACEALSGRGYIRDGRVTPDGAAVLNAQTKEAK